MRLLLLVGNSSIRLGLATDAGELHSPERLSWEAGSPPPLDALDDAVGRFAPAAIHAASVRVVGEGLFVPLENAYLDPREAGVDRLLGALAVHADHPHAHGAVIDFGTALSISIVSPDGVFLGGLIAPGARALARGLVSLAPRLPEVSPPSEPIDDVVQRSTEAAIRAGIYATILGGVDHVLASLRKRYDDLVAVATGGAGAPYLARLSGIDRYDPWLGLRGLLLVGERER